MEGDIPTNHTVFLRCLSSMHVCVIIPLVLEKEVGVPNQQN